MSAFLTAADGERLRSWTLDIVTTILGDDAQWRDEGADRRFLTHGGLLIHRALGCWYCHALGKTGRGWDTVALIQLLKNCSRWEATVWALAWLSSHEGTGTCDGAVDDAEDGDGVDSARALASAATAREILDRMGCVEGTPAEVYLKSRALPPPYPADLLGYAEHVRLGEGALIARLTASGRTTGILVTYIDALGRKSRASPTRRRFDLEKAPGAVFRIPAPPGRLAEPLDPVADYIIADGLEDSLSVQLARPLPVRGLPGVGAMTRHGDEVRKGDRILVVGDGDLPDSVAAKSLTAGVDALLLAGARVRLCRAAEGEDANYILLNWGIDVLRGLVARPPEAQLSFDGRIARLAKLEGLAFEQEREAIHKIFRVRVGLIDEAVKNLRPRPTAAKEPAKDGVSEDAEPITEDPPWEGEADLAAALDAAVGEMPRYLVADDFHYTVIALWCALSHIVQSEAVALPVMPQLAFQSLAENAGKSTALEIVATLAYRGRLRSSYTASTVFRKIAADQVTFCLSELHNILTERNPELQAVVDACHRRAEAYVDRTETDTNGRRYVVTYRCWAALAWASIGPMPPEVQSRAIILPLRRALPEESAKLEHSSPARCTALVNVRRQFAKWAASRTTPLEPKTMPKTLFNRTGDNWRPLFGAAELANTDWRERVLQAAEEVHKVERKPSQLVRLLTDVRTILIEARDTRLSTADLIDKLCEDEEAGWSEANHGKRITPYWLRENLRGLLDPRGSQSWWDGTGPDRQYHRGYELHQLADAARRYLPPSPEAAPASATSATSSTTDDNPADLAEDFVADGVGASATASATENPRETAAGIAHEADVADVADKTAGARRGERVSPEPEAASAANGEDREAATAAPGPTEPVPPTQRRSTIADTILATWDAHPDWSAARIGKACGRSASVVRRILAEPAP
jgi:Protein of unknown function (DUF3631)